MLACFTELEVKLSRKPKTRKPTAAHQRIGQTYETLRDRICTNEYPPETILREAELAEEFEVSRTPIRQVLSMLEHDRLLEVRHGVGNIVTRVEPEQLIEIYTVRMILAQAAGDYYVSPFPPGIAERFESYRNEFHGLAAGDVVGFGRANIRYYLGLTGLVTNSCLRRMQRDLYFQTSRMWLLSLPAMDWEETISAVCDEQDELARLVRLEDPIGLGLAARNHIFMSRRRILTALGLDLSETRNPL